MIVLVVGIGGIYTLTTSMSRERQLGEERQRAFLACQRQLENVRTLAWPSVPGLDGTMFDIDSDRDGSNELQALATSGRPGLVRVTTFATSSGETVYTVTATATWTGVAGRQTYSLETLISNRYAQ